MSQPNLHQLALAARSNPHEVNEMIIGRWSGEAMTGESITQVELDKLLAAASWAPSSFNNQTWKFYYAHRDTAGFTKLYDALMPANQDWCKDAAALLAVTSAHRIEHEGELRSQGSHALEAGMALANLMTQAVADNLVAHAMGGFDRGQVIDSLGINTDTHALHCLVAIGQPAAGVIEDKISDRKQVSEISAEIS